MRREEQRLKRNGDKKRMLKSEGRGHLRREGKASPAAAARSTDAAVDTDAATARARRAPVRI